MSIVVSTPAQICNSPLNNSKSKMLFSFPKSKKIAEVRKSEYNIFVSRKTNVVVVLKHFMISHQSGTKEPLPLGMELNMTLPREDQKHLPLMYTMFRRALTK